MNSAETFKLLFYLGMIVWCLPPIRQHKSFFFDFFLIMAVIDPISLVYLLITKTSIPSWIYVFFIYLLILSVFKEADLKKYKYVWFSIPLVFLLSVQYQTKFSYNVIYIFENTVLLLVFLKFFIENYVIKKKMNYFYLMLVLYSIMNILKFFNLIIGFSNAVTVFVITTIFQITFGFFFSFVRENGATDTFEH